MTTDKGEALSGAIQRSIKAKAAVKQAEQALEAAQYQLETAKEALAEAGKTLDEAMAEFKSET